MDNDKNDKYLMSSVYNTLRVLDLLSHNDKLGVAEISRSLDINKASIFRILYTLEKKNYVHKTPDAKYGLGIKFAHYGSIVLERDNIFKLIRPYLQRLRDKHNETTNLGILDDDLNMVFMIKEESSSSIKMASRVGLRLPFYSTSLGKVLVANQLNEEMENKIRNYKFTKFTDNTVTEYDKLIEMLKTVREQGYGEDLEESEEGLVCFGAPVKDITGNTIAAISVSGPATRMKANKENLLASLKETALEISIDMGYEG